MNWISNKRAWASLFLAAGFGTVAADTFSFDRQLALELSRAYLRAYERQHPEFNADNLGAPALSSGVAAHDRKLVFVSYSMKGATLGYYVELELCSENNLLTVVDSGTVNPVDAWRKATGHITPSIYDASPAVCATDAP